MSSTKNQPTEEIQSKYDTHAEPVVEVGGREQGNCQPVPQEHKNPTLKAKYTKGDAESKDNAEDYEQRITSRVPSRHPQRS